MLEQIRAGNQRVLRELYLRYKDEFILWMSKSFETSREEGQEFYHETYITFVDNVNSGKLEALTSSTKTYLFAIGKYKYLDYQRKRQRPEQLPEIGIAEKTPEPADSAYLNRLHEGLATLGDPCSRLLQLFYLEKQSMKKIATLMGYKSTESARNQKYKCINRLKEIIKKESKNA